MKTGSPALSGLTFWCNGSKFFLEQPYYAIFYKRGDVSMRLHEVERGDGPFWPILIRLISLMSGMRLPDAARAVFYHKDFFGDPMSLWTHAAMRGESAWTVGERELMAAMTAKWNACPFCVGAHGAIAAHVLGKPVVQTALADF